MELDIKVKNSQEPTACSDTAASFLSELVRLQESIFPLSKRTIEINIFSQLSPSETQHSMILCELLNPRGKHNEGNKFLKLFFDHVLDDNDIPFDNKKTWIVTAEKKHYDIWIRNSDNTIIIIIENKSNLAPDGTNQLYRYWFWGINNMKAIGKMLYLTPDSNKSPNDQTKEPPEGEYPVMPENMIKPVFFHIHIDKWLEECIKSVDEKSAIYYYLKQYKDFWRLKMPYKIEQINELFKSKKEQWFSFLDLASQKDNISNIWWELFFVKMKEDCKDIGKWKHKLKNGSKFHCVWYIEEFGDKSFCLNVFLDNKEIKISLGIEFASKEVHKIISCLLEKEYEKSLKIIFERLDEVNYIGEKAHKIVDYCYFIFDGKEINGKERLAWYAHYEPDKLLQEIIKKVNKFIKNEGFTEIMTKINRAVSNQQNAP